MVTPKLQPLSQQFPLVNPDGTPTEYFIRWAQTRMQEIGDGISAAEALAIVQQYLSEHYTVQEILDQITTVQGSILFRGATLWQALAPGTSGHFLKTNSAGADPEWAASGGGSAGDIKSILKAAWAKEMVVNGNAITAGVSRSVKATSGPYVGIQMISNTNAAFAARPTSVTYTVPTGAKAFIMYGEFNDNQRNNVTFYGGRLFNTTTSIVAAGSTTADTNRRTPSPSPGNTFWSLNFTGMMADETGGSSGSVGSYYPIAGVAGDVLRLELWTNGDGNYRIQNFAVYLVVVDATTGEPVTA